MHENMFSCILNFLDIPMVLSADYLRFGTQVPVDKLLQILNESEFGFMHTKHIFL